MINHSIGLMWHLTKRVICLQRSEKMKGKDFEILEAAKGKHGGHSWEIRAVQ